MVTVSPLSSSSRTEALIDASACFAKICNLQSACEPMNTIFGVQETVLLNMGDIVSGVAAYALIHNENTVMSAKSVQSNLFFI